jgi:hypothetical protein
MVNQDQQDLQNPPQQPIQYHPPQSNKNLYSLLPFSKSAVLIGVLIAIAILIPITFYLISNVKKEKFAEVVSAPPKNVSVLYANNVGELFDHKFDTLRSITSLTYIASTDNVSKKEVNVGYSYDDIINKKEKYEFYTTRRGKYIVRKSQSSIEIAPSSNPIEFKTIVSCSCAIHSFIFSNDESRVAYVGDMSLYVMDFNGNRIKLQLPQSKSMSNTPLIAFNAKDMKLALGGYTGMYGGPNPPLTPRLISFSVDGDVKNLGNQGKWDFLSQFSNDLKYAYTERPNKKDDKWYKFIEKYNFQTGKSEELFVVPEHNLVINIRLSPLGKKLAFFLDDIYAETRKLYVISLDDNSIITKNVSSVSGPISYGSKHTYSYGSKWTYFWSPDERYTYLEGNFSVKEKSNIEGNSYIFDTRTQELKLYYKSKGYAEAYNDINPDSLRQIESADFIGWLAE